MSTVFGRYTIVRELGRGAMGVVYEAKDPTLNREVALKVLRPPEGTPEERRRKVERFFQEGRSLAGLSHPNIVHVLDMGETEGRCYLALELIRGTTLRDRISYEGALPIGEICRIGAAVCQALEHMHQRGVVHRDVKPDNIMLLQDGRVKLTDFGVAVWSSPVSGTRGGQPGQMDGSPAYMAPEQLLGQPVDGRADLFSLGVTLYEAATSRRPFQGDTLPALTHQVAHEPAPPAAMPGFLSGILERAMGKSPDLRYTDAAAMAADLQLQRVSPYRPAPSPLNTVPPPAPAARPTWDLAPPPAGFAADTTVGPQDRWQPPGPREAAPLSVYSQPASPLQRSGAGGGMFPAPASSGLADYAGLYGNTSGMGAGAPVPPEIADGWNWGAFTLPLFWSISHSSWIGLLCLFGICPSLVVGIILGLNGNKWAWQKRKWQSIEQFRQVQGTWAAWGIGVFACSMALLMVGIFMLLSFGSSVNG